MTRVRASLSLLPLLLLLTSCKLNLTITSPASDAIFTTSSVPVTFSLTGNEGAATFTCQLDVQAPVPCESGKVYENVPFGRHTVVVTATADGDRTLQTVRFDVVDTDPALEIVRPVDGAVIHSWTIDTMIVRATFELLSTRPELRCQLDGGSPTRCEIGVYGADPANQYVSITNTFNAGAGAHVFTVSAWQNGQQVASDTVSFTIGE
ncbi:MAG TPA: hypothetical protein VI072_17710 [Polyangiaceae bacterium]